jgi:glutamine amidotransferase-like uncharacterized protein
MCEIIVYVDQGVSGDALRQTVKSLQQEIDLQHHNLRRLDAKGLISENWQNKTALLIMPGGRDVYYHSALSGIGTEKIREFVEKGGNYLGLCAGAYFASNEIEFEKGGQLQVCAKRDLQFYPGVAIGPAYGLGKYSYENDQGVEAALISWKQFECFAFFNGGCFFDKPENFSNVEVLSSYSSLDEKPAAIVSCKIGKGKALLSGVHIEYSAPFLSRNGRALERIFPFLEKAEETRRLIFREVLMGFGLELKKHK